MAVSDGECGCDRTRWTSHEAIHAVELRERQTAHIELNRRLDNMNEFRHQLDRQASQFLSTETYDREHRRLQDDVQGMTPRTVFDTLQTTNIIDREKLSDRVASLERMLPLVAIFSAAAGGAITAGIIKITGG